MKIGERHGRAWAVGLIALALGAAAGGPAPAVGLTAPADEVAFEAVLDGAQAVPPTTTGEAGRARLVLDEARGEVSYRIDLTGIRGQPTGVWLQIGSPGHQGETVLELGPETPAEGVWRPAPAVLEALRQEHLSVVVPTTLYPAGEVRGDLRQLSLASDKATWGRLKAIFNGG